MKASVVCPVLVLATFFGLDACASAAIFSYSGSDFGAGPTDPHPHSDAAAAAFEQALGTFSIINFEAVNPTTFFPGQIQIAPGVLLTLSNYAEGNLFDPITGIIDDATFTSLGSRTTLGYNTTPAGSRHLQFSSNFNAPLASIAFTFETPIDAFGAYISGLGTATGILHITFNDDMLHDFPISGSAAGGVQFFGFTDFEKTISLVTFEMRGTTVPRDIFSIDDVMTHPVPAIPEPSATILFALGALFCRSRRG